MAVRQTGGPDDLLRVSVQVTRAQLDWLQSRARHLGVRSVPALVRVMVQEQMRAAGGAS